MPNKPPVPVQEVPERGDPRAERSAAALRRALGQLMHEEPFADLTVQQILDRAGVARATFYSHYRNKDDVLLESFEGMLDALVARIDDAGRPRGRLVPITELLEHFANARPVFESLRASGKLDAIWNLGTDLITALIARRLPPGPGSDEERRLASRMLAGACMESIRWSLDQPQQDAAMLDARFHAFAARLLQASTGAGR